MAKRFLLVLFILTISTAWVISMPDFPYIRRITEESIPMPEIQHELPQEIVGNFTMISHTLDVYITIFPNNKYTLIYHLIGHAAFEIYGHIVREDNNFYFSPSTARYRSYFHELTRIYFSDNYFYFYIPTAGSFPMRSKRREDIPIPLNLANDISMPRKISKNQYFDSKNTLIEFIEVENLPWGFYSHSLQIDRGIIRIVRLFHDFNKPEFGEGTLSFQGFIEKTFEDEEIIRGVIRFTNGIPYYYIPDGTAEIEIKSDGSVTISMIYSPYPEYIENAMIEVPGLEFPARLVLEF